MLSKQTLDTLAVNSGIEADVLAKAISDEQEQELELPKGRFLSEENEAKLLDNHGKRKYDEGRSKGSKENLEVIKGKFSLEGGSLDEVFSNYKTNILEEAKVEPNKKLAEKEDAIKELQKSLKLKDDEIINLNQKFTKTQREAKALSSMPNLRDDLGLKKKEALNIILSNVEVKEDGIYKEGKLQVDEYQNAIQLDKFLTTEVNARGWVKKQPRGHGGKTPEHKGAKPTSYTEFQEWCKSKKVSEGSQEAREYLKTLRDDNPQFNMD